ncbi:UNVERIFIED_CONTAM: hypothetical protein FKN15_042306, partial [Acipenser sinensis]
ITSYFSVTENPERAALYFVSGICIGLILMLCAVVVQISCRTDCKATPTKKPQKNEVSDSDSSDSDWDTTSDLSARRHRRFERTLNMNVFTSAEELEQRHCLFSLHLQHNAETSHQKSRSRRTNTLHPTFLDANYL